MMKKLGFVTFILLQLFTLDLLAQRQVEQIDPEKEEEQKRSASTSRVRPLWMENVSFGGNIGGTIGTNAGFFTAQPTLFYRINDNAMAGAGLTYYYWKKEFILSNNAKLAVSDHAYGFNFFARQQLFDPAFVQIEYMPMNFTILDRTTLQESRTWVNSFNIGGGINQRFSERGGAYILILYDLLHNSERSFRQSPIDFRTGFYF